MPLSPGTRLGRYEVVRLLGAGELGRVGYELLCSDLVIRGDSC